MVIPTQTLVPQPTSVLASSPGHSQLFVVSGLGTRLPLYLVTDRGMANNYVHEHTVCTNLKPDAIDRFADPEDWQHPESSEGIGQDDT